MADNNTSNSKAAPESGNNGDNALSKAAPRRRSLLWRLLRFVFFCGVAFTLLALAAGVGLYVHFNQGLPDINSIMDYRPPTVSRIYSDDGRLMAEFFKQRRYVITMDQMPKTLIQAFVAAEDSRFFEHQGLDFLGILRAAIKNLRAGAIVQGGSTITQQVAKTFFLSTERTFTRKIKEAILARRIDKAFSKKEILYLYLNQIYLGHGAYGVEAAAQAYFGKKAKDLSLAQCAMLAGLPKAPGRDSPFVNPKAARRRQIYVLYQMQDKGYISSAQVAEALNEKLNLAPRRNLYIEKIPWYTEYVRRYVINKYGEDALYNQGLSIYTAANVEMQKTAEKAVADGLLALDKREGFRGPIKRLKKGEVSVFLARLAEKYEKHPLAPGMRVPAVVEDVSDDKSLVNVRMGKQEGEIPAKEMTWARPPNPQVAYYETRIKKPSRVLTKGDVVLVRLEKKNTRTGVWRVSLDQEPVVQGALVCMETGSGLVKAMVGGYDFRKSQFNRAVQAKRQPGSAFKPIIYAAALDYPKKTYTPATVLIDSPEVFNDASLDGAWKPQNYEKSFSGYTLLSDALAHSRNVVTIKILHEMGVDYAIDYARKLGVKSPLNSDLSLALGSSGMPLLELVSAYSVFANQGILVKPCMITKITDRDGRILEKWTPGGKRVISKATAFVMTHLLQGVVEHGTGWRVKALKRPAAGKTGTTNELRDAWFVGYTPRYVTGVWVGYDDQRPMGKGETGSRAASPIWLEFMQKILAGKRVKAFPVPEGVVFAKIDANTGLLAGPQSKKTVFECFKQGTAPTQYAQGASAGATGLIKNGAMRPVDDATLKELF